MSKTTKENQMTSQNDAQITAEMQAAIERDGVWINPNPPAAPSMDWSQPIAKQSLAPMTAAERRAEERQFLAERER